MRGLALLCGMASPFTLSNYLFFTSCSNAFTICSNVSNMIRTNATKPLSGNAIVFLRIEIGGKYEQ
jgi:hypothetical protein